MSLITRCPVCGTMFKVVPDQLRISEGWVRCGNCTEVFDATAYLQTNVVLPSAAENNAARTPATGTSLNATKSVDVRSGADSGSGSIKEATKVSAEAAKNTAKATATPSKTNTISPSATQPILKPKNPEITEGRAVKKEASPATKDLQKDDEQRSWRRLVLNPRSWAAMDAVHERQIPFAQLSEERIKPKASSSVQLPDLESLFEPETGFDFDASLEQSIVATESEWQQIKGSKSAPSQLFNDAAEKTSKIQQKLANLDLKTVAKEGLRSVEYIDSDHVAGTKAAPKEAQEVLLHPFLEQKEPDNVISAYAQLHPVASISSTLTDTPSPRNITALDLALEREALEREKRKTGDKLILANLSLVDDAASDQSATTPPAAKHESLNPEILLKVPDEWRLELAPTEEFRDAPKTWQPPVVRPEIKKTEESVAVDFEEESTSPKEIESNDYPDLDDLSFVRVAQRKAFWRRPSIVVAQVLICLGLVSLLGFQALLLQRDYFAESMPITRPLLNFVCGAMKCEISPYKEIESIMIDASSFNKLQGNAYKFDVVVKNTGHLTLAMPAFELTLLDVLQRPLIRRVLLPSELDAPDLLAAQNKWEGTASIQLSTDIPVSGYRLLAFYP